MGEEHDLTFSIHAPNGLGGDIDSLEERIRRATVETFLALFDALKPLDIESLIIHTVWLQRRTQLPTSVRTGQAVACPAPAVSPGQLCQLILREFLPVSR